MENNNNKSLTVIIYNNNLNSQQTKILFSAVIVYLETMKRLKPNVRGVLFIAFLHLAEIQKLIFKILKNKSGIYGFICRTSNKLYIGSSVQLSTRFSEHIKGIRSNLLLQNAIKKYTLEDFIFIVIEYCDSKELIYREQYYIDSLKPEYNIALIAGSSLGIRRSEETKALMSKVQKSIDRTGENNPRGMLGKFHSPDTLAKMSEAQRSINRAGENHPFFGKTHSPETIALISKANQGKTHTAESKAKIALSLGKKVYLYNKDNLSILIEEFVSRREAAKFFKCDKNTITNYIDTNKIYNDKWVISSTKLEQSSICNKVMNQINNNISLSNSCVSKKESHPLFNTGKEVYLYEIIENKLILKETFINLSRAQETLSISRTTLWHYLKNETVIYSNIKAPKRRGSGFIAGRIKNNSYTGMFRVSLQRL